MVELKETRRLYAMKVIKKELVTDDEVYDNLIMIHFKAYKNHYIQRVKNTYNALICLIGYRLGAN